MTASRSLRERARAYLLLGWAVIVVPFMTKNPGYAGWQKTRLTEPELEQAFPDDRALNIGVLLGEPSGNLADVDLDTWLAIQLASRFLPETRGVFGRAGARRSHRLYRILGVLKSIAWRDPTLTASDQRATLLEIRFSGQTLFPGSTHPNGELIDWDDEGDVAAVDGADLQAACARLAAAVLLARYWPPVGARHDAALALAGGLLRAGWTIEDVQRFIAAVADGAGDDEADDRATAAVSSAQAQQAGKPTTGWPSLAKLIDLRIVSTVITWLGIQTGTSGDASNSSYEESSTTSVDAERQVRAIPVPPFPMHVFPPRIRAYIQRGAASVGCPPDLVAVPFLSYAASAIGKTRLIRVKHRWQHKPTLWTAVVAASGDGKSPGDAYARAPLDELQAEADERYEAQLEEYKKEYARWKASDPNGRGDEPQPPVYEHWYSTDATVESLAPMLQKNAGLALGCDELVAWAKGCNAYKRGGNDRQKYLEIWNGRPLKVDRKTQGVIFVRDPVLGISGGIQPARVTELVRDASAHDGLVQRFLWSYPDVTPADWSWDDVEVDDLGWMTTLFRSLRKPPSPFGPVVLRPDREAREVWKTWYDETLRKRKNLPPLAREFASKYPAQLARLWLVLATLWDPKADAEVAPVARLHDAIALIDYVDAHVRRVLVHFGASAPAVESRLEGKIRAILERASVDHAETGGWIACTAIWDGLKRNAAADDLDAALLALVAAGIAESRAVATGTKPRAEFRLCLEENSFEDNEEFDLWDDNDPSDRASATDSSNSSYEESTTVSNPEPRCFACRTSNWAADGVCLTCHPRPSARDRGPS